MGECIQGLFSMTTEMISQNWENVFTKISPFIKEYYLTWKKFKFSPWIQEYSLSLLGGWNFYKYFMSAWSKNSWGQVLADKYKHSIGSFLKPGYYGSVCEYYNKLLSIKISQYIFQHPSCEMTIYDLKEIRWPNSLREEN